MADMVCCRFNRRVWPDPKGAESPAEQAAKGLKSANVHLAGSSECAKRAMAVRKTTLSGGDKASFCEKMG
jgi:hypothetical protein